jgi:hypothetical protein
MQEIQSARLSAAQIELSPPCAGCDEAMDPGDRFCRRCGRKRGKDAPLHQKPWVVLGMLFFVVGPLALPMLWRSEAFSRNQKVLISVLNLAFIGGLTVGMLMLFSAYMKWISSIAGG